jgi:hypothetical protein
VNGWLEMCAKSRIPPLSVLHILEVMFMKNGPSISATGLSLVDPFYQKIVHMHYWIKLILISLGIKRYQLYKL